MFTQEQLGAFKNVFEESLKPFEDRIVGKLIKRMDEGFDMMDKKIDFVDNKVDVLDKKVEEGFKELQEDMGGVCKSVKEVRSDVFLLKAKVSVAEENKPALFLRR